ncbi:MAG: oxygenase MpaB family protein [Actinomycetota bacterium]
MLSEVIATVRSEGGLRLRGLLTGDEALTTSELATYDDPGLYGPASSAWRVHGDMSMLIGGLRALLLQTLHPLAMAGVADHSDYERDPLGRLNRTGRFIGATTFGTTESAEQMIALVRRIHTKVEGHTPDGRPYAASDPHLLGWVHATEVDSFLRAYDRYGTGRLTDAERDRYVAEMAEIGLRLGMEEAPMTVDELAAVLDDYRAECSYDEQARTAVRFLLAPPIPIVTWGPYRVIVAAAIGMLPPWARRMMYLPLPPGANSLAIRPAGLVLTRSLGWLMNDGINQDREDRLLLSEVNG